MKINYLYNPFTRIAGFKSLIFGLMGLLLTAFLSFISGTHFNGLSNIGFAKDTVFQFYLFEHVLSWASLSIIFYISGLILSNSKIRIIDIAGITILARIPLILLPLVRLLPVMHSFTVQSWQIYVLMGLYFFSVIWTIALLYNGYKISCNLKQQRLNISFIICLLISETATRLVLPLII